MNIEITKCLISGGRAWLEKWKDLMCQAKQFNIKLDNWLTDVSLVWQ